MLPFLSYDATILYLIPRDPEQTRCRHDYSNSFGVRILKYMNIDSVWWHALSTTSLAIAILVAAPKHQSGKFVFRRCRWHRMVPTGEPRLRRCHRDSSGSVHNSWSDHMRASPKDVHFLIHLQ